jgi:hypothetical protein
MISRILTLIAILASSIGFAQEANDTIDSQIIDEIVANKSTCVVGCSEDRIYLNPNRIFPTEHGLYLNLNDSDFVLLPTLNSDSQGCFVPIIQVLPICPGCQKEYFLSCNRPECPLFQRNQERAKEKERNKEEQRKKKKK